MQPEMISSSLGGFTLTVGAAAEAGGAGPGAEDPQIQGDLPEASRTSENAYSFSAASGLRGRVHLGEMLARVWVLTEETNYFRSLN